MNWKALLLAFAVVSFSSSLLSTEKTSVAKTTPSTAGIHQYGNTELDSLDSVGLIKLNRTSILKQLRLTGSLIAQGAKIGSLDISGEANLTDTTIENGGNVIGSFQATRSTLKKNLTVLSQKILITASNLESITIRQDSGFKGKQILELRQGTIINGSVHFESGKGEVLIFPGSQVLGNVTGGKIIRKS